MARRACDGDGLLAALRAAVANLEAHVDEINALNVYPVPDGDTGSNMLATVKAALAEAESSAGQPADRIAAAISFGALMGARGNSGVITSQIFRGMADGMAGKTRFNGLDLAHSLSEGARTAYGAVAKPVEGTILTVIRESAAAAVTAAERDDDIEKVMAATVEAAERSVALTPSLLDVLREAGVVDSGGEGLYRLFEGALLHLAGRAPAAAPRQGPPAGAAEGVHARRPRRRGVRLRDDVPRSSRTAQGRSTSTPSATTSTRSAIPSLSPAMRGPLKVHVHNERPDLVIGLWPERRGAEPDQRREPRPPGPRRPRDRRPPTFTGVSRRTRVANGRHRTDRRDAPSAARDRRRRRRLRRGPGRDLPRLRGRGRRRWRPVGQPEHRRVARGDRERRRRARSSSCPTTGTSCWRPARSPR